jgi:hypothetical protein
MDSPSGCYWEPLRVGGLKFRNQLELIQTVVFVEPFAQHVHAVMADSMVKRATG